MLQVGSKVYTTLDYNKVDMSKEHSNLFILDGTTIAYKVILKECTFWSKIKLTPAISCAILARLVRKIKGQGSEIEKDLMRFYYKEEVRIRG